MATLFTVSFSDMVKNKNHHVYTSGFHDRALQSVSQELADRCFQECLDMNLSPEDCKTYILNELKTVSTTTNTEIKVQIVTVTSQVQQNLRVDPVVSIFSSANGEVSCDFHSGVAAYRFEWDRPDGSILEVPIAADCLGISVGECCAKLQSITAGPNAHGQCLRCQPRQQALTPVAVSENEMAFKDTRYNPQTNSCEVVTYTPEQVKAMDETSVNQISVDREYVRQVQEAGFISCEDLRDLEYRLMSHARAVGPAHQYLGSLACEFCDVNGKFIGDFNSLLEYLAQAFWYIGNHMFNSAVATVTIYVSVSETTGATTIIAKPQLDGRLEEVDCDNEETLEADLTAPTPTSPPLSYPVQAPYIRPEAVPIQLLPTVLSPISPIVVPSAPKTPAPTPPAPTPPAPTPPAPTPPAPTPPAPTTRGPVVDPSISTNTDVGICTSSASGTVVDATSSQQQCGTPKMTLTSSPITGVVSLLSGPVYNSNDCTTELEYKVCNFLNSAPRRLQVSKSLRSHGRDLGLSLNRSVGIQSKSINTVGTPVMSSPETFQAVNMDSSSTISSVTDGHVMLGWIGACELIRHEVRDVSMNLLSSTDQVSLRTHADPDTCLAGVKILGDLITERTCWTAKLVFVGHVEVAIAPAIAVSMFGMYSLIENIPVADCPTLSSIGQFAPDVAADKYDSQVGSTTSGNTPHGFRLGRYSGRNQGN